MARAETWRRYGKTCEKPASLLLRSTQEFVNPKSQQNIPHMPSSSKNTTLAFEPGVWCCYCRQWGARLGTKEARTMVYPLGFFDLQSGRRDSSWRPCLVLTCLSPRRSQDTDTTSMSQHSVRTRRAISQTPDGNSSDRSPTC